MKSEKTLAERGTLLSIIVYIVIASMKIIIGSLFHSSALGADGWNNFTDVLSSLAIFIGMKASQQPADEEHQYGHWKIESIASLVGSFVMFAIGLQVFLSAFVSFFSREVKEFDWLLVITGLIASALLTITYLYNNRLATQTKSVGLRATAQNNLSDAIASAITALSLLLVVFTKWLWLDSVMALIVACIILKTAYGIFKENAFILSDGFEVERLEDYRDVILSHPEIINIRILKARYYGSQIYLNVTVLMKPDLTVYESHLITEDIEKTLHDDFNVYRIDVHVEPSE